MNNCLWGFAPNPTYSFVYNIKEYAEKVTAFDKMLKNRCITLKPANSRPVASQTAPVFNASLHDFF
jgi:hypothetical protein